ncbi:hypothetical protein ACJMK2_017269 [Sinanodonta woodiana]|uniref:B box-type domain-containing protein n=1 Tax=Sinanodonta woodiana TaxID=1069815 RepID=A0ABD3UXD7_SINWO
MSRNHQITFHPEPENQIENSFQEAMYVCQINRDKLTYFCSEHKELCCIKCALMDHTKCEELLSADDPVSDVTDRYDFKHVLENFDVLKKMFVLLIDNRMKTLETIQQQKLDTIKSIKDWSSLIKEQVDKLETTTIHNLEQICKNKTIIISDQVVECKSAIAAIETSETMHVESTKSDCKGNLLVTLIKLSQQLLKYLRKHDEIENRSLRIKTGFQRNKNLEEAIQNLESLGKVSSETSRIPKVLPYCLLKGTFMTPSRVQRSSTFTLNAKIHGDERECTITSGVCLPDKRLVLYDEENRKIKLFDKCFHFLSHLDLYSTSNICIVDEMTVALHCSYTMHLVSVTDSLKEERSIEKQHACRGVASYKQNLMVCGSRDSIVIYDSSHEVSKTFRLLNSQSNGCYFYQPRWAKD